jgi:hypothetical protein
MQSVFHDRSNSCCSPDPAHPSPVQRICHGIQSSCGTRAGKGILPATAVLPPSADGPSGQKESEQDDRNHPKADDA